MWVLFVCVNVVCSSLMNGVKLFVCNVVGVYVVMFYVWLVVLNRLGGVLSDMLCSKVVLCVYVLLLV